MSAASRTVRRLRLRAPSEAVIRRTAQVLEDALRTATLPDAGGRMLFVRRLALGRLQADAPPVSVALALEHAVARVGVEWRHGEEAGAGAAAAVWFRDPLEAHVALARRVLAGAAPEAWYWPLSVPAWSPRLPRGEAVRVIVHSLAARAEAPVALPRWFAELVGAGYRGALEGALRREDVEALARAAGVRLGRAAGVRLERSGGSPSLPASNGGSGAVLPAPGVSQGREAVLRLIEAMLRADGGSPVGRPSPAAAFAKAPSRPGLTPTRSSGTHAPRGASSVATRSEEGSRSSAGVAVSPVSDLPDPASSAPDDGAGPEGEGSVSSRAAPGEGLASTAGPAAEARPSGASMAPASAGGLFFLLNGLERTGYGEWLVRQPEWEPCEVARRVLARVMTRLEVPADDPGWELVRFCSLVAGSPRRFVAPPRWRAGLLVGRGGLLHAAMEGEGRLYDASGRLLLGGWRGPCPRPLVPDRRGAGASPRLPGDLADEVTAAWEIALRRWLRRFARVSVAELVLRPAAMAATPTHLDVHFELSAAEVRIRRAGLDLDPGWVPWFGRVVSFHYGAGGQS